MRNPFHPPPKPPGFGEADVLPEARAPLYSKIIFQWLSPFLDVGFTRPLEKEDLWQLPPSKLTGNIADRVERNFYARVPLEDRPAFMRVPAASASEHRPPKSSDEDPGKSKEDAATSAPPSPDPTMGAPEQRRGWQQRLQRRSTGVTPTKRHGADKGAPTYDRSLVRALHATFWVRWWTAGAMRLVSDTITTCTPLINKLLLGWLSAVYSYHRLSAEEQETTATPRGIGYGIGLVIALFVMQESASLILNHHEVTTMTTGLIIRTSLVGVIFRKALRLSGRARTRHSVGQITTMISSDASRLDLVAAYFHLIYIGPIEILIGVGLAIGILGYSALVGLGVLLLAFPLQLLLVRVIYSQRRKGVQITDSRVRLTSEVLQGVRLIKYYAWEAFYYGQIGALREREVRTIRKTNVARSMLSALVTFLPVLASILSFVTYSLSGHKLTVDVIFSSLQLFNIIRQPLMLFPAVLSGCSDALVALGRIGEYLNAEELREPYAIDHDSPNAVDMDADFAWEVTAQLNQELKKKGGGKAQGKPATDKAGDKTKQGNRQGLRGRLGPKTAADPVLPTSQALGAASHGSSTPLSESENKEKPFEMHDVRMTVPKGAFVAIVGPIGSGKSSVLQAMIGEMRRTRGALTFGGSVAYVPQSAWIMNATLRANIVFGREDDEAKFRRVVRACALEHDLEMLPEGEDTEIGERGINLSGGQKARVSLARAAYVDADIVLLDDPLSAVDAYVGRYIVDNCLLSGPLASKTRILVTHALHVLDKADYIYVMDEGTIVEKGTFTDLMRDSTVFSRLMEEYGNLEREEEVQEAKEVKDGGAEVKADPSKLPAEKKARTGLMQAEDRARGAVASSTYAAYLRYAGGIWLAPTVLLLLLVAQGAAVGNNVFLGYWTAQTIPGFGQGSYMAVYAALGITQAIFSFSVSLTLSILNLVAGLAMFRAAIGHVLRSPTSFFDTTPLGRIMSRLSRDQDTIDTQLSQSLYQFLWSSMNVLGTVALVFYTFPYLGIIFLPMGIFYYIVSTYYRRTSVETKRLDSLMRSTLYASYSETLTGLSTIRAYREQNRFIANADRGLDLENRAYLMTIVIQRWLGLRLDFLGNVLILGIGFFAVGLRHTIAPNKVGVVLSYSLSIAQTFSQLVNYYAQCEQNMNSVERVIVYSELPSEAAITTPNDPPPSWPSAGDIRFNKVELAYRPGLPPVLKGIDFHVRAGEKVGIVGRTGAGKSSLLQGLFRMVELQGGKIEIDGVDISTIGLDVLRGRLALVPQESTLFLGSIRNNLDPQKTRTDAELISAMQRAWLLPRAGNSDPEAEIKFGLDAHVGDEGSNYSAGEKQLVALCRALVKNSRIIVLDEATSSVDVETDAKVQRTIQTEFSSSTLLCIAHRLNTIVYYDRILVMDAGLVAEFDTPLNLFDKPDSIFRSLCNEAGLSRQDITSIRENVYKSDRA